MSKLIRNKKYDYKPVFITESPVSSKLILFKTAEEVAAEEQDKRYLRQVIEKTKSF